MINLVTIKDIVENDLCTGCGACVGESENVISMEWNSDGFLVPKIINGKINDDAIKFCPFNPSPDYIVRDEDQLSKMFLPEAKKEDFKIGRYLETYVGYAVNYRETSSSGGIATYVFEKLLEDKIVEHLFIVKEVGGAYEYQLFSEVDSIKKISKTRYFPVTLEKLFDKITQIEGRVAVSGVACFIKAIRLKQHYYPDLKTKIPFLVGIICGGLKSRLYTHFLAKSAGIEGSYHHQEYRLKDNNGSATSYSFGAYDNKNDFHTMKMKKVGDMWGSGFFKSNACDFCDDVTTELADISVGDAWISPYRSDGRGTSILVTRTKLADGLILEGIADGELVVAALDKELLIKSQAASFKHRQSALKYRITRLIKRNKIVPFKRTRFFRNIPLEFRLVQRERRSIRKASIDLWRKSHSIDEFNRDIQASRKRLASYTRIYHFTQRIKKKLNLKTL